MKTRNYREYARARGAILREAHTSTFFVKPFNGKQAASDSDRCAVFGNYAKLWASAPFANPLDQIDLARHLLACNLRTASYLSAIRHPHCTKAHDISHELVSLIQALEDKYLW